MSTSTPAGQDAAASPAPGNRLGESLLLSGLVVLLIARPIVSSSDPGRLLLTTGGGGLTLNALTFFLLFLWAIWRALNRLPIRSGPTLLVAAGLVVIAVFVFISTAQPDRYQRPGWFIAWDWLALAALVFLTGQLASTPARARRLTAVLIATAACLGAQALYQSVAESWGLPPAQGPAPVATEYPLVGDREFDLTINTPTPTTGTFRATLDTPSTFACFLFLVVPAVFLWSYAGWRNGGRDRLNVLVFLLVGGAFTAAGMVSLKLHWTIPSGGNSAWNLFTDSPWFGIGVGNFSRRADEGVFSPRNYWLWMLATSGIVVAGCTAILLAYSFVVGFRRGRSDPDEALVDPAPESDLWIFYQGGISGLLLGLILSTGDIAAEASNTELLRLGCVAAGRALVWFAVFSILECAVFDSRLLTPALLMGVVGVVAAGFICDALDSTALRQSLWITLTLALVLLPRQAPAGISSLVISWGSAMAALSLLIANLIHVTVPGITTAAKVRSSRIASVEFPVLHLKIQGKRGADRVIALREANGYLEYNMLDPLRDALENDPNNSALLLELARWERQAWLYLIERRETKLAPKRAITLLSYATKADQIDPRNLESKLSFYEAMLRFTTENAVASKEQLSLLDKKISQVAERDPKREVVMRLRVVLALLHGRNQEDLHTWSLQLLRMDREAGAPRGALSPATRKELISRISAIIQNPSQELAEIYIEDFVD